MIASLMEQLKVLKDAARVVPAFKYALGAAALLALVSLATSWKLPREDAIVGSLIGFGVMVLLAIFAKDIANKKSSFSKQAQALAWFFTFAIIAILSVYILKFVSRSFGTESEPKVGNKYTGSGTPEVHFPTKKEVKKDNKEKNQSPKEPSQQKNDDCLPDTSSVSTNFEQEASGCVLDEHGQAMGGIDVYCEPPTGGHIKTDVQGRFTCQLPAHIFQRTVWIKVSGHRPLNWEMKAGANGSKRLVPLSSHEL